MTDDGLFISAMATLKENFYDVCISPALIFQWDAIKKYDTQYIEENAFKYMKILLYLYSQATSTAQREIYLQTFGFFSSIKKTNTVT